MDQLMNTWLPPAVIITVVIYTNRLLASGINKRIDDLRNQMSREHDTLEKHVTRVESKLDIHMTDHSIHKSYEDLEYKPFTQSPYRKGTYNR